MKQLFIFLSAALVLQACNQEESEPDIVSNWHLIEQLADPGDGSGTFQPVSSGKTVQFFEDGTWNSNGSLCTMSSESNNPSTGTFSVSDSTITVDDCGFAPPYPMTFQIQGGFLILNYPCIEPCREKYEPIQ